MAFSSKPMVFLADHTKLENAELHRAHYGACTYDREITLITDEKTDPDAVASLRKKGMEVFQVGLDDINI